MGTVTSSDGTTIAFDRSGRGQPLILVDGALCYRASGPSGPLADLLARHFTVFTYDRRGRGESGDTGRYAVQREVDDIAALIKEAGGSADVYGISSGAALALEAANRSLPIRRLALYEPPFIVDGSRPRVPEDYLSRLNDMVAANRRGDAVRLFMKQVGVPAFVVALMRFMPAWSKLTAVAHTIPYDATVMGGTQDGRPLSADRWSAVTPPTLVVSGGKSPAWIRNAAQELTGVLPDARHRTLEGQTHMVKPQVLAPLLVEFFAG
jgi:pimeloyl-ACP methyl ester carboxylesterase